MKFLRKFFIISLFSFTLVCNTVSNAYAGLVDGLIAYEKGNYSIAFKEFKAAAEQGDADAQNSLVVMYENGDGVRQSNSKAKEWFGKACDNQSQKGCEAYAKLNAK
jgi:TPR repeat protein